MDYKISPYIFLCIRQKTSIRMSSYSEKEILVKNLENFDWNQLSLEQLKQLQSQISKAIDTKISKAKSTQTNRNQGTIYRYKATLAKVSPVRLRSSLSEYQKCVFGISLGSYNFVNSKRLEACIKWISENFQTCLVLVCDSIYRLTIEVRQEINSHDALLKAIYTGEQFIEENSFLFEQYSQSCKFDFQKASQIEKQPEFSIYYQALQCLYQENDSFQQLINSFTQKYLNRGEKGQQEIKQPDSFLQEKMHLGTTYILEESAFSACLIKQGWSVFVYPGSIKTFEEISEGLHPEVPEPLKQMIWVSLRLKKKAK